MSLILILLATTIGILEDTALTYNKIEGTVELPQFLRDVVDQLPLVSSWLEEVHRRADRASSTFRATAENGFQPQVDSKFWDEIAPIVQSCNKQAVRLWTIIRNLELDKSTPALNLYLSTIRVWGDEGRIEVLMKDMIEAVILLAENPTLEVANAEQMEDLTAALQGLRVPGQLSLDQERSVPSFSESSNNKFTLPLLPRSSPYDERLDSSSLRLLEIVSVDGNNIAIRLQSYKFSPALTFDALSYVWGLDDPTEPISCNSKFTLHVTPNLKETLKSLHYYRPPPARPLWIDAICINQKDDDEKSAQIPLMTQIYSQASQAIFWMGQSNFMVDTFLDAAPTIARRVKRGRVLESELFLPSGYYRTGDCGPVWLGFASLMCNAWLTRMWTLQEAILPQNAIVMCGTKWVHVAAMEDITGLVMSNGLPVFHFPEEVTTGKLGRFFGSHLSGAWGSISAYRQVKSGLGTLDIKYIPTLLQEGRMRDVREAVDRIWALAGLFEGDFRSQVIPLIDYREEARKEYWKTYIKFAKKLLLFDPSLGILSTPPSVVPNPRLPTWCPDFSGWPTTSSMYTFNDDFSAGISKSRHSKHPVCDISFCENDEFLRIRGFRLDVVSEVVDDPRLHGCLGDIPEEHSQAAEEWEDACLSLAKRVTNETDRIPNIYGRTLTSGGGQMGKESPESWERAYQHAFRDEPGKSHRSIGYNMAHVKAMFISEVQRSQGRSFFSTRDGRLGRGPAGLQQGDMICCFYGAGPLFILRSTLQDNGVTQLVGDAYIFGCMDFDSLDKSDEIENEVFIIR
ncbi:hypothetical protein H9Q74_014141 [Fusarium xylarioides]|nr:hypothetical protein H9Q71_013604 [Fusarium xylarioides]KAG5809916.1 hypothetical protein H9Q74_014141 [Fusarium xylarioides]